MADITSKMQGNVSNEGMVNWRGDQVSVPQGGQSIYDTASVQLAELGSRKVVGDRVFRYAKAGTDLAAGRTCQYGGEILRSLAVGTNQGAGMRTFTITAATAISANTYAEGYLICEIGATDENLGIMYRIKANALGSSAGTCVLTLYDEIKATVQATSTWSVSQNLHLSVASGSAAGCPLGVAPVDVTASEYFWLQTWGPSPMIGTVAAGSGAMNSVSGLATVIAATGAQAGVAIEALAAATNYGLAFLTIAP